jgi:hypothetical protein
MLRRFVGRVLWCCPHQRRRQERSGGSALLETASSSPALSFTGLASREELRRVQELVEDAALFHRCPDGYVAYHRVQKAYEQRCQEAGCQSDPASLRQALEGLGYFEVLECRKDSATGEPVLRPWVLGLVEAPPA